MKNEKYSSLTDLETNHKKLLELEQDVSLPKTIKEREELDFLYHKGLNYVKELSPELKPSNGQDYLMDEQLRLKFVKIGFQLEKKEFLELDPSNDITETKKELDKTVQDLSSSNKKNVEPPKPEPELTPEKPEEKKEAAPILIDENYLSQELIAKAQRDGLTKETILDRTAPTDAGQFASSLVIDLDDKTIDSTIQQVDERLNPTKTIDDTPKPEEEPTVAPSVKQKSENKLKLQPPKPKPQPQPKQEVNTFKPKPKIDVSANVAELRERFKRNQELNPVELEKEQFQTVLKPQDGFNLPAKEVTVENIESMLQRSKHGLKDGFKPSIVSTPNGPQEFRMKSSLK